MGIGKPLAYLIQLRKTNANEVARKANIHPSTIYSILRRDNMRVDITILSKIAHALDVTLDYFYQYYVSNNSCFTDLNSCHLTAQEEKMLQQYRQLSDKGRARIDHALYFEVQQQKKTS